MVSEVTYDPSATWFSVFIRGSGGVFVISPDEAKKLMAALARAAESFHAMRTLPGAEISLRLSDVLAVAVSTPEIRAAEISWNEAHHLASNPDQTPAALRRATLEYMEAARDQITEPDDEWKK